MLETGVTTQALQEPALPRIRRLRAEGDLVQCSTGETELTLSRVPARYLRPGDEIRVGSPTIPVAEFLATRSASFQKSRQIYSGRIGYVTQPKTDKRDQHFVRAEVIDSLLGTQSLHIQNAAIRDYFYFFTQPSGDDRAPTLYELLDRKSTRL